MSLKTQNESPLDETALRNYNDSRKLESTQLVCHAPFNSMYFMPEGEIVPCCYNRSHLYGKFPSTSVNQAWFGAEAIAFREKIIKKQFDVGCVRCLDQINAGNHWGVHARIYDRPIAHETKNGILPLTVSQEKLYPEILEFELSNICNLECIMCGGMHSHLIRKNREKLPPLKFPYNQDFVRQLEPFIQSAKVARFLGGEPFLIPIYYDIWERFIEINPDCELHITTNGTVFNKRVWRVLENCKVHPVISVDSLNPENYESIRKNADFNTFISNIESLQVFCDKKNIHLTMSCCPMRQNWNFLIEVLTYCNKRNIRLYFNTVVMPESASLRFLPKTELYKIVRKLTGQLRKERVRLFLNSSTIIKENIAVFENMIAQINSWAQKPDVETNDDDPRVTHLLNIQGVGIEDKPLQFKLTLFDRIKGDLDDEQIIILCKRLFLIEAGATPSWGTESWLRWLISQYRWEEMFWRSIENNGENLSDHLYQGLLRAPVSVLESYSKRSDEKS
ncbi:MAG: radical SAM protein [Flavobacteriales bacterium]|nr:radical SAM protein [Flavobacteriales bacterium]